MSHERLAEMTRSQAAESMEQASKQAFEGSNGLGTQLFEMRDKDPKAYSQIMKAAGDLAAADKGPNKATALHNLELMGDLDNVKTNLKDGNVQGLQTSVNKLNKDSVDDRDKQLRDNGLIQTATDAGLIAIPYDDGQGHQDMVLHRPGSAYGLKFTAQGTEVYNWHSGHTDPSTKASQVMSDWSKEGPASDADIRKEAQAALTHMGSRDQFMQVFGGDFNMMENYFSIAYSREYGGKSGLAGARALSADLKKSTGLDVQISEYPDVSKDPELSKYPPMPDQEVIVNINFGKNQFLSGWELRK